MKERFKKLTLLTLNSERSQLTARLQQLGVVHLELDEEVRNETISELEHRKVELATALGAIRRDEPVTNDENDNVKDTDLTQIVKDIISLKHEYGEIQQQREMLRQDSIKLSPWGDFDWKRLKLLEETGWRIYFYVADKKKFDAEALKDHVFEIIYRGAGHIYFVVIAVNDPDLPFDRVELPKRSLPVLRKEETKLVEREKELKKQLSHYLIYQTYLEEELSEIEDKLAFQIANTNYSKYQLNTLASITGWYPISVEKSLVDYLKKEEIAYSISNPRKDDNVPVLLRNKKYPRLFEPITRIFELPNYYELDLTPYIAVFYPILFAYCLGDAGYGLVLTIAAVTGYFTFLKKSRSIAVLGIILGLMTTLLGVVKSGSVFGLPIITDEPGWFGFLEEYVIITDNQNYIFNAFNVALMIGVIQVLIGIFLSIVNLWKFEGFKHAVSQIGKLFIVVGLIWLFLADMQEMAALQPLPEVRKWLFVAGIVLVLLFHDLSLTIFKRILGGALPLFFIFTGILGDILSYVRLFALGVASSVLGLVVNQIGMQIMEGAWWGIVLGVIFLIFGHTLNFAIASLGAFVHPLRLTFVEFYNNARFTGGGIAYRPFSKHVKTQSE